MTTNTTSVTIRDYTALDRNFILATWLRGTYYGVELYTKIPKAIFMENYHRILEKFLATSGLIIKVACLKDDPEVVLGYSVSRSIQYGEANINILDWMFVKSAWRGIGIGKMLLPARLNACTHLTKSGQSILKQKMPDVIYNPFLFG